MTITTTKTTSALAVAALVFAIAPAAVHAAGVYSSSSGVTAGAIDNPIKRADIAIWENAVASYAPAPGVSASFSNPTTGLASLGDLYNPLAPPANPSLGLIGNTAPGSITLTFANSIYDGPGADFAVFENGFANGSGALFAEFAYVEVSSDSIHFARFDSISLNTAPVAGSGAFAYFDMTNVYNLAGKHAANWGTPFDLSQLANHDFVTDGFLDLAAINYVRLVDVVGSGSIKDGNGAEIPGIAKDSLGNPILDNWVTTGSGGFDYPGLPAGGIGVLHAIPEPGALTLAALLATLGLAKRRR
jgi:hypothetical protein